MKESLKLIVEALLENGRFLSYKRLSELLELSTRYISQVISESQDVFDTYGFRIENVSRTGYQLSISDISKFEAFILMSNEALSRAEDLLKYLIDENRIIHSEELAETFFTSRSTIDRLMKVVREIASRYDLKVTGKSKLGIEIEGSEINKRLASAHCGSKMIEEQTTIQRIQEILFTTLHKYDYMISDMSFNNLVYHVHILLKRIRSGGVIVEEITLNENYPVQTTIVKELVERLEYYFLIDIPDNEINYLVLHLLGKQIVEDNQEIPQEIFTLAEEIITQINLDTGIDLRDDFDLKISLCLHLQPLLFRLKYRFNQENPLLSKVKREMTQGYELSLIAKSVIKNRYNLEMNDHEASYLAMHFSLSLAKTKQDTHSIRLLLICSTGRGTSRLLQYKLMERYGLSEESITLSSLMQLRDEKLDDYTCIISTITIPYPVTIPVFLISPMLDEVSSARIEEFINKKKNSHYFIDNNIIKEEYIYNNIKLSSQEKVLKFIAKECAQLGYDEDKLYEELLNREKLSSTEVGNQCCMPHPLEYYTKKPIVMILILKKPIYWKHERVRYVFFCATPQFDESRTYITDGLSSLVCSKEKLHAIANNPTAQEIYHWIEV